MYGSKKILLPILLIAAVGILIAVLTVLSGHDTAEAESSAEESALSEVIVVPSEMPTRISLQTPSGFTETASDYYDRYYVREDASIIVTGEELSAYGVDAEAYAASVKEQYAMTADNFVLLSEEGVMAADVPCKLLEFTYDIVGAERTQAMECLTAVLVKDDFVYLITCKSHQDTYSNYRGAFRQMIDQVQIASADEAAETSEMQNPVTENAAVAGADQTETTS